MTNFFLFLLLTFYQTADYHIDLGMHYESQKQDMAQGYVETFTILDETGKYQFIISITKVTMADVQRMPNVYEAEYKQAFLSKCGCDITSSEAKQFKHFKAQEFKVFRNGRGACIYSIIKDKNLFSITYSALGDRNTEEKYPHFEKVMNTIVFL